MGTCTGDGEFHCSSIHYETDPDSNIADDYKRRETHSQRLSETKRWYVSIIYLSHKRTPLSSVQLQSIQHHKPTPCRFTESQRGMMLMCAPVGYEIDRCIWGCINRRVTAPYVSPERNAAVQVTRSVMIPLLAVLLNEVRHVDDPHISCVSGSILTVLDGGVRIYVTIM